VSYLLLGFAVLGSLLLVIHWFAYSEPKDVARILRRGAVAAGTGLVILLVLTGQIGWLLAALPAFLPWFMRFRSVSQRAKAFKRMSSGDFGYPGGGSTGRTSEVRTRFIHAVLDHDTGRLDGDVIEGTYAGRRLSDMTLLELAGLLQSCTHIDPQSAQVVETFLDRAHENWREELAAASAAGDSRERGPHGKLTMSREEALEILGLDEGADEKTIKAAYHRLMANVHPDRGGTSYLAAKINEAKDILLGK
jgi:hypothetical protein